MRTVKSVSGILRITGIVLIILALVLVIYASATNGSDWTTFSGRLREAGASVTVWDRFSFNHAYFLALRDAIKDTSTAIGIRAEIAAGRFEAFYTRADKAEQDALDQSALELETWFNNEFDVDAFLANYDLLSGNQEAAQIREIFEYLDGLSSPQIKSGKVLPGKLTPVSSQSWFDEHYGLWVEQYGEEVGSYLAYLQTFERMVKAKGDVTDARVFAGAVTYEDYQTELAITLAQENSQDLVLFLDTFADLAAMKADDPQTDIAGFLRSEYQALLSSFSASAPPDYAVFLTVIRNALTNLGNFDGSYSILISRILLLQNEKNGESFATFMRDFSRRLVQNSDSRRAIPLTALAWLLAAQALLIGLTGILLIGLAALLSRLATRTIIKKREYKTEQDDPDVLLLVKNLSQYFKSGDYVNKAVDNVSFYIKKGEVFGLVGESGCGKTTTGRTIINLYDPTNGDVYFKGLRISSTKNGVRLMRYQLHKELAKNIADVKAEALECGKQDPQRAREIDAEADRKIAALRQKHQATMLKLQSHAFESEIEKSKCAMLYHDQRKEDLLRAYEQDMQGLRGMELDERKKRYQEDLEIASRDNIMAKIQMIFQDPIASINPRMTVREIIAEGLIIRGVKDKALINRKVNEMLDLVGLVPEHASRYPHEFSGGQRQRIGIARAIVLEPELIIADEPISALDVSIQAQIINLLNDLRKRMGLTLMFIAHNLSVVKYFSDRIAVMYYGVIVEMAPSEELFLHPLHPYTKSLLSAIPYPDPHYEKQRKRVEYEPVLAHDYTTDKPELREIVPGHFIHCNQEEFARYGKELGI